MLNARLMRVLLPLNGLGSMNCFSRALRYQPRRITGQVPSLLANRRVPTGSLVTLRFFSSQKPGTDDSPVAKQETPVLRRENIWTIPNILTMGRLVAAPVIGYLIVHDQQAYAVGLTVAACITDYLDGYIARKYKAQSAVGSILDPAADKALMITLASCLSVSGAIPLWCGATILGRDILLLFSAIFVRYASLPPPKTFLRYWDLSIPSVKVTPTTISKWNTLFQMVYLGISLANPVIPLGPPEFHNGLAVLVTATTILSGFSYITNRSAVKFIK